MYACHFLLEAFLGITSQILLLKVLSTVRKQIRKAFLGAVAWSKRSTGCVNSYKMYASNIWLWLLNYNRSTVLHSKCYITARLQIVVSWT